MPFEANAYKCRDLYLNGELTGAARVLTANDKIGFSVGGRCEPDFLVVSGAPSPNGSEMKVLSVGNANAGAKWELTLVAADVAALVNRCNDADIFVVYDGGAKETADVGSLNVIG